MDESSIAGVLGSQLAYVPIPVWRHAARYDRVPFAQRLRVADLPAAARVVAGSEDTAHEALALGVRLRDAIEHDEIPGWGCGPSPTADEVLAACEAELDAVAAACMRCAAWGPRRIREALEGMLTAGVLEQVYEEFGEVLVQYVNEDDAAGEVLVRALDPAVLFAWHVEHRIVLGPAGVRAALDTARNVSAIEAAALVTVIVGGTDDAARAIAGEDVSGVVLNDVLSAWVHGAWLDADASPLDEAVCWHRGDECGHSQCEHDTCAGWWHEPEQSCEEISENEEVVEAVWKLCAHQVQEAWARRGALGELGDGDVLARIKDAIEPAGIVVTIAENPDASEELLEACVKHASDHELAAFARVPGAVVREALERVVSAAGHRNTLRVTKGLTETARAAWESMSDTEQAAFIREHWQRSGVWIQLLAEFAMRPAVLVTLRFDQIQALDHHGVLGAWFEAELAGVDLDALIAVGAANTDVSVEELIQVVKRAGGNDAQDGSSTP